MRPKVIAHRGASKAERENTVEAFRRAEAMGADWVELDVRPSADGVLVVHHDAHLSDGRAIVTMAARDLPGHISTLAQAIEACGSLAVNVEIKNDPTEPDFDPHDALAGRVVELLRSRQWVERVVISSFRLETVDAVRALAPDLETAWLVFQHDDDLFDTLLAHGHHLVHPWWHLVDEAFLDEAHRRGIRVNTWTVDDPDRLRELVAWGIDGICTNVPDVLLALLD